MDLVTLGAIAGVIASLFGVVAWFSNRRKSGDEALRREIKEWTSLQLGSIGRTLDNHAQEIDEIIKELAHHSHKISQSDVVMVHIDETLKQLGAAVTKLDQTLNTLQVSFAKMEGNKREGE